MFCKYCGSEIKDTARFCSNCGKKLKEVSIGEKDLNSCLSESLEKEQKVFYYDLGGVCNQYTCDSPYAESGSPLNEKNSKKYCKAIANFVIDTKEQVYFIYDTTAFGNCKRGFAICSSGIYGCDDNNRKFYISWNKFKTTLYKKNLLGLKIENMEFTMALGDNKPIIRMLDEIKNTI